jgi:hypothetical protein
MREPQQTFQTDEEVTLVVSGEEATLVAPRFDDEETLVARPVVPLGGKAAEARATAVTQPNASPLPAYARRPSPPRRSWVLVLVLVVSVLVGGVLGGAGLYLYQRQSNDAAVAPPQAETPAETQQQPVPAPTAEVSDAPQPVAPATDAPAEAAPAEAASDETTPPAREPETAPAVERDTPDADANAGTRKRGKKGEHDEEIERRGRRESRPDSEGPVARADDSDAREARRVDTIFYRPRRAERQAERRAARRARRDSGDTDRLRRIFEGTPE